MGPGYVLIHHRQRLPSGQSSILIPTESHVLRIEISGFIIRGTVSLMGRLGDSENNTH